MRQEEPVQIDGYKLERLPIMAGQILKASRTATAEPTLPIGGVKALVDFDLYAEANKIGMDFRDKGIPMDWDKLLEHLISNGLVKAHKAN